MSIMDLVTGEDGKLSHTKTWSNVGYATVTGILIFTAIKGTMIFDMYLAYMVVVATHQTASKFITAKFANKASIEETSSK